MLRHSAQNAFLKLVQNDEQEKFTQAMKSFIYNRPKLFKQWWGDENNKAAVLMKIREETKIIYRQLFEDEWVEKGQENGTYEQIPSDLLQQLNQNFIKSLEMMDLGSKNKLKKFEAPLLILKGLLKEYTWHQEEIAQKILDILEAEKMIEAHSGDLCDVMSENWEKLNTVAARYNIKPVIYQLKEFKNRKRNLTKCQSHVMTENGMQTVVEIGAASAIQFLNEQCKTGWSGIQESWGIVVKNEVLRCLRALTFEVLETLLEKSLDVLENKNITYAHPHCYTIRESERRFAFFRQFIFHEAQLYAGLFNHVGVITCRNLNLFGVFQGEEYCARLSKRVAKNGVHISLSRNMFQKNFDANELGLVGLVSDWKYHAELLHEISQNPKETIELAESLTELGDLCKNMNFHEQIYMSEGGHMILDYVEAYGILKYGGAFGSLMLSQFRVYEMIESSFMDTWEGFNGLNPDQDNTEPGATNQDISKDVVYYALLRANMILKTCQYPKRLLSVCLKIHKTHLSPKSLSIALMTPRREITSRVLQLRIECSGGPRRLLKLIVPLQKVLYENRDAEKNIRTVNDVEGVYLSDEEVDELYEKIAGKSHIVMGKIRELGLEREAKKLIKATKTETRNWRNLVALTSMLWILDLADAMAEHCLGRDPGIKPHERCLTGQALVAVFQGVCVTSDYGDCGDEYEGLEEFL